MSSNIFEKLGVFYWNRVWSKDFRKPTNHYDLGLFVGEPEDIPDRKFGFLLPRRREYGKEKYKFVGYILNFNPEKFLNKKKIRQNLGYGPEPLIICSIGGTMIGKELLNLCGKCYPILQKSLPNIKMVLVCGPRLSPDALQAPPDVEIKAYVPNLFQHFAACDLAVVQGGYSSTIELTALHRPFLFFPLDGHCEQQIYVSARLARHNAGTRMDIATTTPELMAEKILSNIGKKVKHQTFTINGAEKAASLIIQLL
jgi:predicted glycosyltransferase